MKILLIFGLILLYFDEYEAKPQNNAQKDLTSKTKVLSLRPSNAGSSNGAPLQVKRTPGKVVKKGNFQAGAPRSLSLNVNTLRKRKRQRNGKGVKNKTTIKPPSATTPAPDTSEENGDTSGTDEEAGSEDQDTGGEGSNTVEEDPGEADPGAESEETAQNE